jgi:hypothetical protein
MKRGARDHPIGIRDTLRNRRISKKRAPWRAALRSDQSRFSRDARAGDYGPPRRASR